VLVNLAVVTLAYVGAFALRFDVSIPWLYVPVLLWTLPLLLACKAIGLWSFDVLQGWWRHVSLRDVRNILAANAVGSALFLAAMVLLRLLGGFPRSVFLLDLLLCTSAMAGMRIGVRLMHERQTTPRARRIDNLVLIVGAGSAGIRLLEEIEGRPHKAAVVGFVDDDPAKLGLRIAGCPVLGTVDQLPELVQAHDAGEVLIAIPSAAGATLRRIVQQCAAAGVRHRVLPSLGELVEGRVMYSQMRDVKVEDLLARDPVRLDLPRVRSLVTECTVMVTGAAGSIGSELCRQVATHRPARLVLFDRHENGMFALDAELRGRFPDLDIESVLGDVILEEQVRGVMARFRPELVFHAAAYKHVPIAERNVIEAVRNNVLGTRNVAAATMEFGGKEFVLVSTDKAVRPTSVMGVTKRVAELVVQSLQNGGCRFVSVRFGNVLGSNGSVVPIFREQMAHGGPITVTHPDVTRYFMLIPEAAQLILQAAAFGHGGEVFMLEMGDPVRIVDLARQMIRLSGLEPDEDVAVVFTGLRPGEKLHEELVGDEEEVTATHHERIKVLRPNGSRPQLGEWLPKLQACVGTGDVGATLGYLKKLVPSYRPSDFAIQVSGTPGRTTPLRRAHA